ncbi:MAG: AEC family transporter, partial [Brooklawnia sp.]
LIALGLMWLFGLRGLVLQSIFLAVSMPSAVNTFLLALEYDRDTEMVASIVAASTMVSMVTISVVVAYLPLLA